MSKLVETLTSRKLWATVAAAIPLVLAQDWVTLAQLVMVFLAAQAGVDIAGKLKAAEVTTTIGAATVSGTLSAGFVKALESDLAKRQAPGVT